MDMISLRRNLMASDVLNLAEYTVTGNPVSFTTQLAKPVKSITVPLSCTQEGTGDPSPTNIRPISGVSSLSAWRTGVNIFDEEFEEGMLNDSTGEDKPSSSNIRSKNYISVVPGKQYYVKYTSVASGTNIRVFFYYADKSYKSNQWANNGSITIPADVYYVRFYMDSAYSTSGNRKISINYPYTETEYVPYSGGVRLDVVFPALWKNLLKVTATSKTDSGCTFTVNNDGTITVSGTPTQYVALDIGIAYVTSNDKVTISGLTDVTNVAWDTFVLYDADDNIIESISGATASSDRTIDLSEYQAVAKMKVVVKRKNTTTAMSGTIKPMVEIGETASEFEPYCDAVYGGSLDLVSGVLTIERIMYSLKLSEMTKTAYADRDGYQKINIPFAYKIKNKSTQISNLAKYQWNMPHEGTVPHFFSYTPPDGNTLHLYLALPTGVDGETIFMICAELENPLTIQLNPHSITAIKGANTIWTDTTGDLIIKYLDKA